MGRALLAVSVRGQQTNPDRLGPEDGLLMVTVEGKHGFIDLTGRIVIPPTFSTAAADLLISVRRSGSQVVAEAMTRSPSSEANLGANQIASQAPTHVPVKNPSPNR